MSDIDIQNWNKSFDEQLPDLRVGTWEDPVHLNADKVKAFISQLLEEKNEEMRLHLEATASELRSILGQNEQYSGGRVHPYLKETARKELKRVQQLITKYSTPKGSKN